MGTSRNSWIAVAAFLVSCGGSTEPSHEGATSGDELAVGAPVVDAREESSPSNTDPASVERRRSSASDVVLPAVAHGGPIRRVATDSSGRFAMARSDEGVVSFYDRATRAPRIVARVGGTREPGDIDLLAISPGGERGVAGTTDGSGESALVSFDIPSGETTDFIPSNERLTAYWLDTDPSVETVFVLVRSMDSLEDSGYELQVRSVDGAVRCVSPPILMDLPWNQRRGFVLSDGTGIVLAGEDRTYVVDSESCEAIELEAGQPLVAGEGRLAHVVVASAGIVVPRDEPAIEVSDGAPPVGSAEPPVVGVVSFTSRHSVVVTTESSAVEWTASGPRPLRCGAGATRGIEADGRSLLISPRAICDLADDVALGNHATPAVLSYALDLAVVADTNARGRDQTQLVALPSFRVLATVAALRGFDPDDEDASRAAFTRDGAFVAIETVDGIVLLDASRGRPVRHRLPRAASLLGSDGHGVSFAFRLDGEHYESGAVMLDPRHPLEAPTEASSWTSGGAYVTAFDLQCQDGTDVVLDVRGPRLIALGPCVPRERWFVPIGGERNYAIFHGTEVELHDANASDTVILRTLVPSSDGSDPASGVFGFAVDATGRVQFAGEVPPLRVRRVGDARNAELVAPRADGAPLAAIARILGTRPEE